ncbi:MAG: PKD domain-containing protein, partial [archaeon]
NITSYHWDFGDGKTSTQRAPTHSYSASADYSVTLIVTDNDNLKATKTEVVHIRGVALSRVTHPHDIPVGAELSVSVTANQVTDITLDIGTFHETRHGNEITFHVDTNALPKGENTLTVTAESDTYTDSVIVYDPAIYRSITKGIDDLGVYSKAEMREISGITGYTLTNHVYSVLQNVKIHENITVSKVVNELRNNLNYVSENITSELEKFKDIAKTIDSATGIQLDGMDSVVNTIVSLRNAIDDFSDMISEQNIVPTINRYVTTPALYAVTSSDEGNLIDERTQSAKHSLNPYYTQQELDEVNAILLIGKEAISNTDDEEIYRLDIGTIFGHDIALNPTLDYFSERQSESINPPNATCILDICIEGKYNPSWVYHMTVADIESVLTVPAYIGWIPATPEDETIQPSFTIMFDPITVTVQAIRTYMKYADMVEKVSPWVIDGGMIISTDLLAKEVNEEHGDIIQAIADITETMNINSVGKPGIMNDRLYIPKGNMLVTTSPDGKIRDFKYAKSDSLTQKPKTGSMISLNTGWSQSFTQESQNIDVILLSDKSEYSLNDTVYLTVSIYSDAYIEDAMIWIFVPEENLTIKDIVTLGIGNTTHNYNFTIHAGTWHVPRVYVSDFGTVLGESYTTFSIGSESRESGLIMIDYDEFYTPGTIDLNVTVYNTGNIALDSELYYFSPEMNLRDFIDVQTMQPQEQITEKLSFDLLTPGVYEVYFALNSITGVLDYNAVRFTVSALGTLLAFPETDKPIYAAGENVDVAVAVKNITLNVVDFPYALDVVAPSGDTNRDISFVPADNGTYIVKARPIADGYYNVEGETLFIVERQSDLVVEAETSGNVTVIHVRTDIGGAVEGADVIVNGYVLKTDEDGGVEFIPSNATQLFIQAEKFGFNPAVASLNLSSGYEESTSFDIVPMELNIVPEGMGYTDVKVTPSGMHSVEIRSEICRDLDFDYDCDEVLPNMNGEISVLFEDSGGLTAATDSAGEAAIRIKAFPSAPSGARYLYYVRLDGGDWKEAYVNVGTTGIPEYPFAFLIPIVVVLYITRKYLVNLKAI